MSRELLILRHAKSSWADPSLEDFDRPLKGRGKRDAVKMGHFLLERGLVPDVIFSSPARRARQTIRRVCKVLGYSRDDIIWDESIYLGEVDALLKRLRGCAPEARRAMIVGHNPDLEELTIYLSNAPVAIPADGKLLPTATLAHLRFADDWAALAQDRAELLGITRPKSL